MNIKRSLAGLGLAGLAFGGVYGAMSTLSVSAGNLQAGGSSSLACQSTPITVSWGTDDSQSQGVDSFGNTTFAQLSGVNDTACAGDRLYGRVENSTGAVIGYTTLINSASGAAETFQVAAVIGGPTPSGYNNPETATGTYKLQLIGTDGHYGVNPAAVSRIVLWVES